MSATRLIATLLHMKRTLAGAISASIALSLPFVSTTASAAIKPGSTCKQLNQLKADSGLNYICVQKGKKLTWVNRTVHYEQTKLKAYSQIRAGADSGNLENVKLVYHTSKSFPKDLEKLYTTQVEYASKLYGSFFGKQEVMNIYMYTEKDQKFIASHKIIGRDFQELASWLEAWRQGRDQEHNLGLAAWYMETTPGVYEGHAGVLVSSEANAKSLRKYAIQVMPHEYWHVVQDYFFKSKFDALYRKRADKTMDGLDFYSMYFPTTFREGSANTISFALTSNTKKEYLDLYRDFIQEKKRQTDVKTFATLTSTAAVESALKKIEDRRKFSEAHEASYSLGALLYEWLIAEYGFDAYRKIIENQVIGNNFEDNIQASLGMSVSELYKKAAPHILSAFSAR